MNAELHRIHSARENRICVSNTPSAEVDPHSIQAEEVCMPDDESNARDESCKLDRKLKRRSTMLEHSHIGNSPIGTYLQANALIHQIHAERQARNSLSNLLELQPEHDELCLESRGVKRAVSERT